MGSLRRRRPRCRSVLTYLLLLTAY
jgi:hypothetical protein